MHGSQGVGKARLTMLVVEPRKAPSARQTRGLRLATCKTCTVLMKQQADYSFKDNWTGDCQSTVL